MANLWIRMTKLFGGRWASQYGDCDDGTWRAALAGVASDTLGKAIGLVAASGREFPPSLPEFLAICARACGLPDCATAYRDAAHRRWTHAVVYETARRIGVHEVTTLRERDILPAFREAFGIVCAEWMSGTRWQSPAAPAQRIARPVPRPTSREDAMRHLASIRAQLGFSTGAEASA